MTTFTRRGALAGAGAALLGAAACNNGIASRGPATIDARVAQATDYLYATYPGTVELRDKSTGQLVMPLVTQAGFGLGGSYGRGALLVQGSPIDYYSATQASVGLQIGAQQYAHMLFFMTNDALFEFRNSPGWVAGAELQYVANARGANAAATTLTQLSPVIAVIFGQAGLIAGATVEGTKYTRIIP